MYISINTSKSDFFLRFRELRVSYNVILAVNSAFSSRGKRITFISIVSVTGKQYVHQLLSGFVTGF
jgi:hypothetical protein